MVFEIGGIISNQYVKVIRILNAFSAALYNILFAAEFVSFIYGLVFEDKGDFEGEDGPVEIFEYMFLAYNMIFHFPVVPINHWIVFKEI